MSTTQLEYQKKWSIHFRTDRVYSKCKYYLQIITDSKYHQFDKCSRLTQAYRWQEQKKKTNATVSFSFSLTALVFL